MTMYYTVCTEPEVHEHNFYQGSVDINISIRVKVDGLDIEVIQCRVVIPRAQGRQGDLLLDFFFELRRIQTEYVSEYGEDLESNVDGFVARGQ